MTKLSVDAKHESPAYSSRSQLILVDKVTTEERERMIAEAAYYLAEGRGFQGGDHIQDWLEAESEIDHRLMG